LLSFVVLKMTTRELSCIVFFLLVFLLHFNIVQRGGGQGWHTWAHCHCCSEFCCNVVTWRRRQCRSFPRCLCFFFGCSSTQSTKRRTTTMTHSSASSSSIVLLQHSYTKKTTTWECSRIIFFFVAT
jgi:hypothetical protein